MAPRFEVHSFGADSFYAGLANKHFTPTEAQQHDRAIYLFRYLDRLRAKSIVVEHGYTDRDYLDDFAAYYVKCYRPYESRCKRLHFFRRELSESELLSVVRGGPERDENLQEDYLGFIVARPLPRSVVGRTVLRTFEKDGQRRNYTATCDYKANLFGIELAVRKSLAFQEQDTVLAACATVALWSSFQKTADLFDTPVLSPVVITQAASQSAHYGRPIPSHGLEVREMCLAIRSAGLEPELVDVDVTPNLPLVSLLYSYLKMGLPVILGVRVEGVGGHAIALTGYSLQPNPIPNRKEAAGAVPSVPMVGLRIDGFYGHDDQIGPFARLDVMPPATVGSTRYPACFESSWVDKNTGKKLALYPHVVIIPVYHKIRLTFLDVQKWVTRLHLVLDLVFPARAAVEWDIHLGFSNEYKKMVRSLAAPERKAFERLLVGDHPRFIWRAALSYNQKPMLELLFDATDIANSFPAYEAVWPHRAFARQVQMVLEAQPLRDLLVRYLTERFWKFLTRSIRDMEAEAQPTLGF